MSEHPHSSSEDMAFRRSKLGIYLIIGKGGRSFLKRALNLLPLKLLLIQVVHSIRTVLKYADTIHVVTDMPFMLWGLRGLKPVSPRAYRFKPKDSRWFSMSYKWDIEEFADSYEYLMYFDCDTILRSSGFLSVFFESDKRIMLAKASVINQYTSALLSKSQKEQNSVLFDPCFFIAQTELLIKIFARCRELYQEHPQVFDQYSDMPFFNRSVIDLYDGEAIPTCTEIILSAQQSSDFSKDIYHFNSGNLFTKCRHILSFYMRLNAMM